MLLFLFSLLCGPAAWADEPGFRPLFNGKDLSGWEGDLKLWKVADNTIVGDSDGIQHNQFLMSKEELKEYYKAVLNNGEMSLKGGGGLGMIDIARKTGEKLNFSFSPVDDTYSFFSLNIKISQ